MTIATVNVGSSTFKYAFFDDQLVSTDSGEVTDFAHFNKLVTGLPTPVTTFGHRLVHGGNRYFEPTEISQTVLDDLESFSKLAPLHNPPALAVIRQCIDTYKDTPNWAVFDTGFYKDLPSYARLYPLPVDLDPLIQHYGFHGTSHQYVAEEAASQLKRPLTDLKLITVHLGAGCSITAIEEGRPIDTSMGFTPLEGLMMATRSGSIDPAIIFYLIRERKMDLEQVEILLNKESGLLGVSGLSADPRVIISASQKVSPRASEAERQASARAGLALQMYAYRVRKYIGSYFVALGGLDALVFTGKVGENSPLIREMITNGLEVLGKFPVLIIPTNEALAIARQVKARL